MNDKPITLKVKEWLEVNMPTTPFLRACTGIAICAMAFSYGASIVIKTIAPNGFF